MRIPSKGIVSWYWEIYEPYVIARNGEVDEPEGTRRPIEAMYCGETLDGAKVFEHVVQISLTLARKLIDEAKE